MMRQLLLTGLLFAAGAGGRLMAQNTLAYQCTGLGLNATTNVNFEAVSEDDQDDLAEAWAYLIGRFSVPGGSDRVDDYRLELHFPTKKASWHWTQASDQDKNDSLQAYFVYNTDAKSYGHTLQAYAKDFTIEVTRYDSARKGVVEGNFHGTLAAYLAWNHQTVEIPVKGSWRTTRNGLYSECRKLRRFERAVLDKARDVLNTTVGEPLKRAGWVVESVDASKAVVASRPRPYRPMMLCSPYVGFKLKLDPASALGRGLQDSAGYYAKVLQSGSDMAAKKQAMVNLSRIQQMMQVEISIYDNSPFLKEPWVLGNKDRFVVLDLPGAAYACRVVRPPKTDVDGPEVETDVYVGNWKGGDMHAKDYGAYPFVHKTLGPWLETLRFKIVGPKEVADAIFSKIDWNGVGAALTK